MLDPETRIQIENAVGKLPDKIIAEIYIVHRHTVGNIRRKLGIPPVKILKPKLIIFEPPQEEPKIHCPKICSFNLFRERIPDDFYQSHSPD